MSAKITASADGTYGSLGVGATEAFRFGSDNSGQLAGFRNKIINGGFNIWQRGTSFSSAGYTADRWYSSQSGLTVSRLISGLSDDFFVGPYGLRINAVGASAGTFFEKIEGVKTLSGGKATFSVKVRLNSGSISPIEVYLKQDFGTGGSPSATIPILMGTFQPIGSNTFTLTVNVPSNSGTLGTDNNNCLWLQLNMPAGTYQLDFSYIQLEEGSIATPFEQRPIGLELSLCQRYCVAFAATSMYGTLTLRTGGTNTYGIIPTPVPMRAVPQFSGSVLGYCGDTSTGLTITPISVSGSTVYIGTTNLTLGSNGQCALIYANDTPNFLTAEL